MSSKLDTRGLDSLLRNMNTISRNALSTTAEGVVERARNFAPVESGELRDSLDFDIVSDEEAQVFADAPHAPFVELGTSDTAPQPFLKPATEGAIEDLEAALQAELERFVRG